MNNATRTLMLALKNDEGFYYDIMKRTKNAWCEALEDENQLKLKVLLFNEDPLDPNDVMEALRRTARYDAAQSLEDYVEGLVLGDGGERFDDLLTMELLRGALQEVEWEDLVETLWFEPSENGFLPNGCSFEFYHGECILVEDVGVMPLEYWPKTVGCETELIGEQYLVRWTMRGYMDCGEWHYGDTPIEALQEYAEYV